MSKQVNRITTTLTRIDKSLLYATKVEAIRRRTTVKSLIEEGLSYVLADESINNATSKQAARLSEENEL